MDALHIGGSRPRPSQPVATPYSPRLASHAPAAGAATDGGCVPEIQSMDNNLGALCEHVQVEGWNSRSFSDIVVKAMGRTFQLHRLILSRSSYFRHMLQGPWKEAGAPEVTLQIDDENVNGDAVATALAYLYGHYPKLDDSNAFRVLATGSFLDLQDLCALCTNFIISELWTENFLGYQAFAESQDYGIHGERVRKACWGYLCRGGAVELREILPKLSTQTLRTLLTSDELWVPSEEKRFELALGVLVARGRVLEIPQLSDLHSNRSVIISAPAVDGDEPSAPLFCNNPNVEKASLEKTCSRSASDGMLTQLAIESPHLRDANEVTKTVHEILFNLADTVVANLCDDRYPPLNSESLRPRNPDHPEQFPGSASGCLYDQPMGSPCGKPLHETDISQSLIESREACTSGEACSTLEQGTEVGIGGRCGYEESWEPARGGDQCGPGHSPSSSTSHTRVAQDQWLRERACLSPSWGGRVVQRRMKKAYANTSKWGNAEDWEAFLGVFEGGGVLYCHMAFGDLLDMRGQLEELGFPCRAVADGLWLQTLLRQQVLTVAADTCKNCSLIHRTCTCRQFNPSYPHGRIPGVHHREDRNTGSSSAQALPGAEVSGADTGSGGGANGQSPGQQGRIHARTAMDGLAGIGRATPYGPPGVWPAPRYLYIPSFGAYGARGGTQSGMGNNQSGARGDLVGRDPPTHSGTDDLPGVLGVIQGGPGVGNSAAPGQSDEIGRVEELSMFARLAKGETPSNDLPQKANSQELNIIGDWESGSISLDLHTPLRSFPPFRFGVEFEEVHRLGDGQSKHSPETFHAGSLWKVSVQAFNDEDPRGRRTLGLFLHRRKAEDVGSHRKVSFYTDTREKVTARYQLICPAKRGVMILGSLTQAGTLLPKAPKGWGWRTAFLFDELGDLLQGGSLRVAAVVQLV